MRYLLDTNVVSDVVQGTFRNKASVANRFSSIPQEDLAISVLSVYELHNGLLQLPRSRFSKAECRMLTEATLQILEVCVALPLSASDAAKAAELQSFCQAQGRQMGGIDACIAGQAANNGLVLVSHDKAAFGHFPKALLSWEDWLE